ncbi:putative adenosine deaminase [Streptococcus suis R61]|uniref:Adenosine deaminase n=1 Tax=Streptococcus suis R61 TaxID=996306 RepID=A0AA87F9N1_STRSU|nr:adenosine deaminase [Streptococcus suis]EHC03184.1 putative adenosine deaminase [Streptococcus suis R61]MBY4982721.1 adenosine deaminase [Streptococcus suis]MBY4993412.1 adenosine deaminase [Streptococcus suis]MBY5008878.1 adenosine deaminase [Streptococcus suis]MCK3937015.1 adenosine deaminase [Streptococcus suis]
MLNVNELVKTELHCHLDGSLSLGVIRQLAQMAKITIPAEDEALRKLVSVHGKVDSLMAYLKLFDFVRPLLQTATALELAAYDLVRQAASDKVIYIEVRFAPELSTDQDLTILEAVSAVLVGLNRGQEDFGVVAKLLVCGLKQTNTNQTKELFSAIADLAPKGLVGFDFAGNEADYPTHELAELIDYTQSLGYPMTFHAGECGCVTNVAQALALGIKRIGHGTALSGQAETIQAFVNSGATLEMCLTSNLQTGAAQTLTDFPYEQLVQAGAKITINTDNRTVSNTNLNKEYQLFIEYFGTTKEEFHQFNRNAIQASFASEEEKANLLDVLAQKYNL